MSSQTDSTLPLVIRSTFFARADRDVSRTRSPQSRQCFKEVDDSERVLHVLRKVGLDVYKNYEFSFKSKKMDALISNDCYSSGIRILRA